MGLKTDLIGKTFTYQPILSYGAVSALRTGSKGFFTGQDAPSGSGELFLRPPLTKVWVGQTLVHWLPYFGGTVTALKLSDAPVLTGKMSGCPLALFLYGGSTYLGHVGTVDDNEHNGAQKNADVKKSWNTAVAAGKIRPIRAWSPAADIDVSGLTTMPHIFGMATAQSKIYSLRCTQSQDGSPTQNDFTIAAAVNGNSSEGVQCVRALLAGKESGD